MSSESRLGRNRGYEYAETIRRGAAGRGLLDYLASRYDHSAAEEWRARIRGGQVRLDGRWAAAEERLREGQRLSWRRPPWREPEAPVTFAVLHEDRDLLVVAKPAGLPTLPGAGFLEHTLLAAVRASYPEATPVHRLGRWTSGLAVLARSSRARSALAAAWRLGEVDRRYRTLASGTPPRDRFGVDVPIGRVPYPPLGWLHAATSDGRPAASQVQVLSRRAGSFLAEVRIRTGRPHQIRIHLAAAGCPLWGDPLYARGGRPAPGCRALPGDPGYLLHAAELAFPHPVTGRLGRWSCASPPPLRAL